MTLDLSSLEASAGAELTILHPADDVPIMGSDDKPVVFQLVGIDSDEYRAAQRAATNRRLGKTKRFKITAEQLEAEVTETLVHCTVGWSDNFELDGQPVTYSSDAARTLYQRFLWLREQVQDFIEDRANFLKA